MFLASNCPETAGGNNPLDSAPARTPAKIPSAFPVLNCVPRHNLKSAQFVLAILQTALPRCTFSAATWPGHPVFPTQTPSLRSTQHFSLRRVLINQEALRRPPRELSHSQRRQEKASVGWQMRVEETLRSMEGLESHFW